ncbi:hypothetical protein BDQ17DRAFT_1545214 [Cyathus striatus]|nr:hypothetical protein BDQ17DRAFT_1545214 [Cyathus striatus]
MRRTPSRAPSPTPTAFSGISNYRTDSYRPTRDNNAPAVPQIDYRQVSRTHFDELGKYLAAYLAKAPANSRSSARQKLTRLTIQQFHELSTDVYDELVRRKNEQEVPFLPVREEFHPKRNQARQKLATLPATRFEDLSSDVYFELSRRYPEFKEDPSAGRTSSNSNYDDRPAPDFPANSPPRQTSSRTSGRLSVDRPSDSGYSTGVSARRPSDDRRRPSEDFMSGRRSQESSRRGDGARSGDDSFSPNMPPVGSSRRKPSQDISRRDTLERPEYGRRPSAAGSMSQASDSTMTINPTQSTTATSAMIIPTKSTIEEEYIEVPYGREGRESGISAVDDRERSGDLSRDASLEDREMDSASDYPSPLSPRSPPAGLSGLSARLGGRSMDDDDDDTPIGASNRSGEDYYDKFGRSSVNSDRSMSGATRLNNGRASGSEDQEKLRRDYEYKIATIQTQVTTLQRELGDKKETEKKWKESEARVRQLEEELVGIRRRAEEQSTQMLSLQKELEEVRESRQREKERDARRAQQDEEELQILRDRCEKLDEERENRMVDVAADEQLQSQLDSLITELDDLSRRYDELMTSRDSDLMVIRNLDNQLKEYKRKYEQAKTELRNVKATSQLFVQGPKIDKGIAEDQLPVSSDGGILDVHVTAFLSAIDGLLTAGRSNSPTRVLIPMKAVVNAVTNIIEDVRAFERRPQRDRSDVDSEVLKALRVRADSTLANLAAAAKTHATSSAMSPVSLLDAAASHLSATITELGRTLCIRRATKAELEQFSYHSSTPSATATNGFMPSLRSVDESRSSHQRKASQGSISSRGGRFSESPSSPPNRVYTRRPPSENSSSEQTNSPPPIFDLSGSTGMVSDDSAPPDTSEDAWSELKPYLEAQTEAIVYAIQNVLSGVRNPTPPPTLMENLTQIITIVSSIVAVCNDNLPPASSQQGSEILRELSEQQIN